MDSLLNRYRSIVLLLVVLVAQLIFLAYQVKTDNDVRVIRVWAVTVITPIAQIAETTRGTIYGVFHNYFDLRNARNENREMRTELGKLKLENQFLTAQLNTADRVKALSAFEKLTPSRLLAARIIGTATTSASKIVFLDRGSNAAVEKGMAVITPDGIVGKILDAYPTASQALLATDPGFAAGVVSQKNHVRGILRGMGSGKCKVDMVQNEEKVDVGEMFYTSGDDRIFPRGMPVGKAAVVREGAPFKDILVYPAGLQNGPEEVLIVLHGVHQLIPENAEPSGNEEVYLGTPPPEAKDGKAAPPALSTDADRMVSRYKQIGEAEGHKFGEGNLPNFNVTTPARPSAPPTAKAPDVKAAAPDKTKPTPGGGEDQPLSLTKQRPATTVKPATPLTKVKPPQPVGAGSTPAEAEPQR